MANFVILSAAKLPEYEKQLQSKKFTLDSDLSSERISIRTWVSYAYGKVAKSIRIVVKR